MARTIKILRNLLIVYLIILLVFPVGTIISGWFHHEHIRMVNELQNDRVFSYGISVVLIVCGFTTFANIVLGCVGVCLRHSDIIITFGVILCVVCISTLSVGIALLARPDQLDLERQREIFRAEAKSRPLLWNSIQTKYHCCGIDGPKDWQGFVPKSCCFRDISRNVPADRLCSIYGKRYLKTLGCFEIIKRYTYSHNKIISICMIATVFLLLIGIALSFAMACAILRLIELREMSS